MTEIDGEFLFLSILVADLPKTFVLALGE